MFLMNTLLKINFQLNFFKKIEAKSQYNIVLPSIKFVLDSEKYRTPFLSQWPFTFVAIIKKQTRTILRSNLIPYSQSR